jgi:DNA-directed RNA polymerase subunit beta'
VNDGEVVSSLAERVLGRVSLTTPRPGTDLVINEAGELIDERRPDMIDVVMRKCASVRR